MSKLPNSKPERHFNKLADFPLALIIAVNQVFEGTLPLINVSLQLLIFMVQLDQMLVDLNEVTVEPGTLVLADDFVENGNLQTS